MFIALGFTKNAALTLIIPVYDAEWGELVSSAAGLDTERSQDGGAFSDCTNEMAEIGSSGVYSLALTAAELNYDSVFIKTFTSTNGAKIPDFLLNTGIGGGASGDDILDTIVTGTVTVRECL